MHLKITIGPFCMREKSFMQIGSFIWQHWHILCPEVGAMKCVLFTTVSVKIDLKLAHLQQYESTVLTAKYKVTIFHDGVR